MNPIRALVVDDEAPARERMIRLLKAHAQVEIVGEAAHGLEALEKVAELTPDLVFLDIEMPELDGLGVAASLPVGSRAQIVFVTAYHEHALRAFELAAADYLVKPVSEARLASCLDRLRRPEAAEVRSGSPALPPARRLAVRSGARFVVFDPAEVSAITAADHYAALRIGNRELLADETLDALVARLDPTRFLRVHRGSVINLDFLRELECHGDRKYVACLSDVAATRVAISRERLGELKARLGL